MWNAIPQFLRFIIFIPGFILGWGAMLVWLLLTGVSRQVNPPDTALEWLQIAGVFAAIFLFFFIIGSVPGITLWPIYALWRLLSMPISDRSFYFFYQVFALILAMISLTLLTIYLFYEGKGIGALANYFF